MTHEIFSSFYLHYDYDYYIFIMVGHIGAAAARDAASLGMNVVGYDPGLSIESALKLPIDISLEDSIVSAVAKADYVSINIPYIKGEGGTHGIIGPEVVSALKAGAVVLNFARGELVDSQAMKNFLDTQDGRYVSDFPDDLLWDHKNSILLPHLGASTEEAEDAAVRTNIIDITTHPSSSFIKLSLLLQPLTCSLDNVICI
jgi:D-3-phosphoglycerate dehydrogenase